MRGRITFSLSTLGHRLRSVPMLVMLLPFTLGIVLYESYVIPLVAVLVALFVASLCAWLFLDRRVSWCYAALATLLLGYTMAELRAPRPSLAYDTPMQLSLRVESQPVAREGYRMAEGRITGWSDGTRDHSADDKVVLWIRSDSIAYGHEVTIYGHLTERISRHASYDRLQHRRGRVGGVGISDRNIISYHPIALTPSLQQRALDRLGRHTVDSVAHAVVEAMVAGSRRNMPASLSAAYSQTGLAHLMAVSGLHLGIVAMVVVTLLLPLRFIHRGHRVANLLTVVAIWLFAAMSGMSPSVVRAALMFSLLQVSLFSSSRYSSLNALAVASFFMLVYRPDYLYDISFELSVLAVAGIVLWAVPVMRSVGGLRWLPRTMITTLAIGAAATLWTLPLVSHTFGNLPIASVVLTPMVMLFSYLVVAFGILSLILPVSLAAYSMSVAEWAAGVQNSVVSYSAALPYVALDYTVTEGVMWLCYALYIAITLVAWSVNRKKMVTLSYVNTP